MRPISPRPRRNNSSAALTPNPVATSSTMPPRSTCPASVSLILPPLPLFAHLPACPDPARPLLAGLPAVPALCPHRGLAPASAHWPPSGSHPPRRQLPPGGLPGCASPLPGAPPAPPQPHPVRPAPYPGPVLPLEPARAPTAAGRLLSLLPVAPAFSYRSPMLTANSTGDDRGTARRQTNGPTPAAE